MSRFRELPNELWIITIRYATLAPGLLDVSLPDPLSLETDPESLCTETLPTKLSLALVCRRFNQISLPYLYEYTSIRSSMRLRSLTCALECSEIDISSTASRFSGLGRFVKYVELRHNPTVAGAWPFIWNADLSASFTTLCRLCPHLQIFRVEGAPLYVVNGIIESRQTFSPSTPSLQQIDWDGTFPTGTEADSLRATVMKLEQLSNLRVIKITFGGHDCND
jgi:hypothetical protein